MVPKKVFWQITDCQTETFYNLSICLALGNFSIVFGIFSFMRKLICFSYLRNFPLTHTLGVGISRER